jgi:hypothetical protein
VSHDNFAHAHNIASLLRVLDDPDKADDTTMALLCVAFFGAVSTMTKTGVLRQFIHAKSILLSHFMQQVDKKSIRGRVILLPNTLVLTVFVIFPAS